MDSINCKKSLAPLLDQEIANCILYKRQKLGLSQSQVAREIGCTYQQYQKYETGANRISAGKLYEICSALDINLNDLYHAVWFRSNG